MLEVKGLSIAYNGKEILNDISFTAEKGKLTTIIGKNGCGKSSIVSCINRTVPYKGVISCNGVDLSLLKPKERARQIAILPQTLPMPDVSVEELVFFGRAPYLGITGRSSHEDRKIVKAAMEFTHTDSIRHRSVSTLSGGERQKAFLAMILAQDTGVIVLDEPTTYMDVQYEASFLEMIGQLREKKTILMIMHDLTDAVRISDKLTVINNGAVAFDGDARVCAESGIIEEIFGVKQHIFTENGQEYRFFSNF